MVILMIFILFSFVSTSLRNLSTQFWSRVEISSSQSSSSYPHSLSSSSATSRQLQPCNIDPVVEAQIMDRTIDFEVQSLISSMLHAHNSMRPSVKFSQMSGEAISFQVLDICPFEYCS